MSSSTTEAERRRSGLRVRRICRFCLVADEPLSDIYRDSNRGPVPLPIQVMACVAIEVFPSDGMPTTICDLCRYFMDQSYRFKQICKQGDEALRQYVAHGELRTPIEWPQDMIKNVPSSLRQKIETKKAISEIDAKEEMIQKKRAGRPRKHPTNEITKKDSIDISIEDAEDAEPPTKIRVTQLGDDLVISRDDDENDFSPSNNSQVQNKYKNEKPDVSTGVFPCPHCERSFPLQQLLDIHVQNHFRERTHHCKECNSSFFNKYDLHKHEITHYAVKDFQCNVCNKAFNRITMLRRHEKIHMADAYDAPQFVCDECDQTFISQVTLSFHYKRNHERKRDFACMLCPKKFSFKQGLERHFAQHNQQTFKCNYCDLRFATSKQLIRHVRTHAGHRPHPCKFCPKSFILSHHYTRHLRTSHLNKTKQANDPKKLEGMFAKNDDSYKCMECDESFTKQDDLIFHSAIHATQNLTCPICKEKFQDVDAVTTHIKLHVEGEQFVCDYCELVFTSEDKLDMHIDSEHQEALNSDTYNSFIREKVVGESEVIEGLNDSDESYDEEDELYDSTQQSEAKMAEMEEKDSQLEVEVDPDGKVNVKILDKNFMKYAENSKSNDSNVIVNDDGLTYAELKTVDTIGLSKKITETDVQSSSLEDQSQNKTQKSKPSILARVEEIKKKTKETSESQNSTNQKTEEIQKKISNQRPLEHKGKVNISQLSEKPAPKEVKTEVTSRTNEKSLKLLEKDLMELQKAASTGCAPDPNSRFSIYKSISQKKKDVITPTKTPYKPLIPKRNIENTSPKITEDKEEKSSKKLLTSTPLPSSEKRSSTADDTSTMSDNDISDNELSVRRSTRPSKVKNYAAMVRDQEGATDIDDSDYEIGEDDKDDYEEKQHRIIKPPKPNVTITPDGTIKRKRGRPRKNATPVTPSTSIEQDRPDIKQLLKRPVGRPSKKALMERAALLGTTVEGLRSEKKKVEKKDSLTTSRSEESISSIEKSSPNIIRIPSGQKLTKVTADMVKILPPGIKPLPLPPEAGAPPGVCQMKIGEKLVRVQKIVMSKAEVQEITKKGLVEIKDGAMVLKAGVKLPTSGDSKTIKNTLLRDTKDMPGPSSAAKEEPKPTRFGGNSDDDDNDD